jgi:hypothetical protein
MAERESLDDADPLLTRKAVVADLCSVGIPLSFSRLEKLCMVGEGPPVDCYWGKRPLTRRSNARKWAQERMASAAANQAIGRNSRRPMTNKAQPKKKAQTSSCEAGAAQPPPRSTLADRSGAVLQLWSPKLSDFLGLHPLERRAVEDQLNEMMVEIGWW